MNIEQGISNVEVREGRSQMTEDRRSPPRNILFLLELAEFCFTLFRAKIIGFTAGSIF